MSNETNRHLAKKSLYAAVIGLCGLLILCSVVGIIGAWAVQSPLNDAAAAALNLVEEIAGVLRASIARVDQPLARLQEISTNVLDATQQIGQAVGDQGLILTLLPKEREEELTEAVASVRERFTEIRETIANGVQLYRSIDRLPFVNLPGLDEDQVEELADSVAKTQALAEDMRSGIAAINSGVVDRIGEVETAAGQVNQEIAGAREQVSDLDTKLVALQAAAGRIARLISAALIITALLVTLLSGFLIFTQVQVIRMYADRWRLLNEPGAGSTAAAPPGPESEAVPQSQ